MSADQAPWQVVSRNVLYSSRWGIDVALWSVRLPDGRLAQDHPLLGTPTQGRGYPSRRGDGRILMIDRYRVITGRRGWELPAGRVDTAESVEETAQRELLEETGYTAGAWATLGEYNPSNGSSNQLFHLKIARELMRRSEAVDRNETMGMRWFTVPEILELVRSNGMPNPAAHRRTGAAACAPSHLGLILLLPRCRGRQHS